MHSVKSQKYLELRNHFEFLHLLRTFDLISAHSTFRMASNECFSLFTATEDIQILHYYGLEVVTTAKRVLIASLVQKTGKVEVEDFLKQTFSNNKQIILAPYFGGSSFSLDDIPFEQLEEICAFKPSCEPSPIVGSHNTDEYNSLHSAFVNSPPDDRAAALEACTKLRTQIRSGELGREHP